jgi:hypothetical protein
VVEDADNPEKKLTRMRYTTIMALVLCIAGTVSAQNEADVQRYTNNFPPGTARFSAMGGAFTALGGDMSGMHINPAGIAVFRFSELSLTPSYESATVGTSLMGTATTGNYGGFALGNAGFVLVSEVDDPYWRSVNVGFSINRVQTFNDELSSRGILDIDQSLMQSFVNEANGFFPADLSSFGAGLAFDAFVIDPVTSSDQNTEYIGRITQGQILQQQTSRRTVRMNEFSITFGGNYDDRLFIGGALGIQSSFYQLRSEITESPTQPLTTDLMRYRFSEDLRVEGFGVNFSAGFIYRLENGLRLGGSIQTPTTLRLQDVYRATVNSTLVNPDESFREVSPDDFLEYRVRTPWRFSAGIAGVVQSKAILSAQYEYVNFRGGQMLPGNRRLSTNPWQNVNDIVTAEFRAAHILRGGIEFRMNKSFMARGGVAFFPNTIPRNNLTIDGSMDRLQIAGGIGYRAAAWNLDLAYSFARFNEPYRVSDAGPIQELQNTFGVLSLTLGLRL